MDGANRICVILRPVAVLASFGYPGHILVYAPGDILTSPPCHKPDDLADSFSCFLFFVFNKVEVHEGLTGKKRKASSARDGAIRANKDVSASFRFAGYSLIPGGEKWTSVFLRINKNINKRIILTGV
ncbi:hypothetical protein ABM012_13930 [Morganella morganii]|uniref:hypothetical protein n=1 Tax=Morganella morganii TaxID=582 RepID=UPI003EBDBAEE